VVAAAAPPRREPQPLESLGVQRLARHYPIVGTVAPGIPLCGFGPILKTHPAQREDVIDHTRNPPRAGFIVLMGYAPGTVD